MAARLKITCVQDKGEYIGQERTMTTYPEAYSAGTIIYRLKANCKKVEYCMILDNRACVSGMFPSAECHNEKDYLTYLWNMRNERSEG